MMNVESSVSKAITETTVRLLNGEVRRTRQVREVTRNRVDPERYSRTGDPALRETIRGALRDQHDDCAIDFDLDRLASWEYDRWPLAPWDDMEEEWHIVSFDSAVSAQEQEAGPARELREFADTISVYLQLNELTDALARHLRRRGYTYAARIEVYEHSGVSLTLLPGNLLEDDDGKLGRTGWDSRASILIFGTGSPEDAERVCERFAAYVGGDVYNLEVHSVTVWDVAPISYTEDIDTGCPVEGSYRSSSTIEVETEPEDFTSAYGWGELRDLLRDEGFEV